MCPVQNSSAAWVCVYYLGLISVRSIGLGLQSGQFITQERFKSCRLWEKHKNLRYHCCSCDTQPTLMNASPQSLTLWSLSSS
jgi:hypothetical protein